jgi:hypothetical protein
VAGISATGRIGRMITPRSAGTEQSLLVRARTEGPLAPSVESDA